MADKVAPFGITGLIAGQDKRQGAPAPAPVSSALGDKIAKARAAGYSAAEITTFLGRDPALAPKIQQARAAGYGDDEIVGHLGAAPGVAMRNGRTPGEVPFLPSAGSLANFNRGLGIGDEIAAGVATARDVFTGKVPNGNVGNAFARNLRDQRALEDTYTEQRPNTAALARGTGNATTALVPTGATVNAFANAPRLANAARGAVSAGVQAAAFGAVDRGTAQERLAAAGRAAVDPVALGLGAIGGALGPARSTAPKAPKGRPVSLETLKAQKAAAYAAVDKAGVTYKPEAIGAMVSDIASDLGKQNLNPTRHPKAASMLADLDRRRNSPMTLTELDQLRQEVRRDVVSAGDPAEKYMGRRIIDGIDRFIETAGPRAVSAGSAKDAATLLATARDLNAKYRKVEAVEGAVGKAKLQAGSTGSGGNIDNAIRQKLRSVLEKTPNFTPEERAALERVVMGGKGQNALRQVGKLSPQGNGLMAAMNLLAAGGGGAAGGPAGALAGMAPGAAGLAAKTLADRQTRKNVEEVLRIIASENPTPAQQTALKAALDQLSKSQAVTGLRRAAAAKLGRAGAAQGGNRAGDAVQRQRPNALASGNP